MAEKIRCAAIQFEITHIEDDKSISHETCIEKAMNHATCFSIAYNRYGTAFVDRDHSKDRQGFITTSGRFVDREEAYQIALAAGQLKYSHRDPQKTWLDSYEVNFALE